MPKIEFDGGAFGLPAEHLDTLQKAAAYRALAQSDGYRRLLDFLEAWANQGLEAIRGAQYGEDRVRANLQLIWTEREKVLAEVQREVQRGIAGGKALADDLDQGALIHAGLPMEFSDNE